MHSCREHREPWYAVCCKTLALRRSTWRKLDQAWDEQSLDSETGSTKSGTPEDVSDEAAARSHFCIASNVDDEEFFSDVVSDEEELLAAVAEPREAPSLPDFAGHWTCTSTWGLGDFLKESGFSRVQRMAATRAPWPEWVFEQRDSKFVFVNRGSLGDIREEFVANRSEYFTKDGWKQTVRSKAHWEDGVLVIERDGPQGSFREERRIDADGILQFCLHSLQAGSVAASWGRTFKRKV